MLYIFIMNNSPSPGADPSVGRLGGRLPGGSVGLRRPGPSDRGSGGLRPRLRRLAAAARPAQRLVRVAHRLCGHSEAMESAGQHSVCGASESQLRRAGVPPKLCLVETGYNAGVGVLQIK